MTQITVVMTQTDLTIGLQNSQKWLNVRRWISHYSTNGKIIMTCQIKKMCLLHEKHVATVQFTA